MESGHLRKLLGAENISFRNDDSRLRKKVRVTRLGNQPPRKVTTNGRSESIRTTQRRKDFVSNAGKRATWRGSAVKAGDENVELNSTTIAPPERQADWTPTTSANGNVFKRGYRMFESLSLRLLVAEGGFEATIS